MTDATLPPEPMLHDHDHAEADWQPVAVWLPTIALCATRMGLRRRLLLPGVRRVRMSRRLKRRIYRR